MTPRPEQRVTDPELLRWLESDAEDEPAPPVGADPEPPEPVLQPGARVTDPDLIAELEGPDPESWLGSIKKSAADLGRQAVSSAKELDAEYGGAQVGGTERLALRSLRNVAAGAAGTVTGAVTQVGGLLSQAGAGGTISQTPGLQRVGELVAAFGNKASDWVDKTIATKDQNL